MHRVVVVGGGIAGLASAWLIREEARVQGREIALTVLEAAPQAGGHTRSERADGFLCEVGPNGFLDNEPATLELVARLGLKDRLVAADELSARRYIYHSGKRHQAPSGPGSFLVSGVVPPLAKLRMACEVFVPQLREEIDESAFSFCRRRLGEGFARYLLDPMVSGVFAGDPKTLSLQAAFPKMAALERDHGGLFKALLAKSLQARARKRRGGSEQSGGPAGPAGSLHTFVDGMGELTGKLAAELDGELSIGSEVLAVERDNAQFTVRLKERSLTADSVVMACPSYVATNLVRDLSPELAAVLADILYSPVSVDCRGYPLSQLGKPLDGFGVLVPRREGMVSLGVLCSDRIFPSQAPADMRLLRTLVGGAQDPDAESRTDSELSAIVDRDLGVLFEATGQPAMRRSYNHQQGIAQYTIGHLDRVAKIEALEAELPGLLFTGAAYRGVSINGCVKDAFGISARVVASLARAAA